jgi:5-methyltetrahydrofolate--homocysteine methyltransferase
MDALAALLDNGPVLVEGAMGTMLMSAGLPAGSPADRFNLERPDLVADIHRQYADAGVRIHFSNTFNGNRLRLHAAGLGDRCAAINREGARIAREVAGPERLVGGSIGPTGSLLEPLGTLSPRKAEIIFAEQAEALVDGGVDLLWIETMVSLTEVDVAIAGCRRVSDLPIGVSMTFTESTRGFFTMMGHTVADCAQRLRAAGAAVLGSNCQLNGAAMVRLARAYKAATSLPLAIQPNAGQPELRNGKPHYTETPDEFAHAAVELAKLNVELIGGCCGTTPEFIAAARARL